MNSEEEEKFFRPSHWHKCESLSYNNDMRLLHHDNMRSVIWKRPPGRLKLKFKPENFPSQREKDLIFPHFIEFEKESTIMGDE